MIRPFRPENLWAPRLNRYQEVELKMSHFKKVELEIGAGAGMHPLQRSKEQPDHLILALERTLVKFKAFQATLTKDPRPNLLEIHADAIPWVWHLDAKVIFEKIWILYPNPEVKKKSKRWVTSPFFHHLVQRLASGGEMEMATNLPDYAEESERSARELWGLKTELNLYTGPARTHFEKKYLDRNQVCYQLILKKE